jgi:transcriptional regulator with XRE-family HTH domain
MTKDIDPLHFVQPGEMRSALKATRLVTDGVKLVAEQRPNESAEEFSARWNKYAEFFVNQEAGPAAGLWREVNETQREALRATAEERPDFDARVIGQNIRFYRDKAALKLEDLAKAVGTDTGNLSRLERGKQGVSVERLTKIAAALKVKSTQLTEGFADPQVVIDLIEKAKADPKSDAGFTPAGRTKRQKITPDAMESRLIELLRELSFDERSEFVSKMTEEVQRLINQKRRLQQQEEAELREAWTDPRVQQLLAVVRAEKAQKK